MWTKEERAEYMKRYRADPENKERARANSRYYYKHHKEKIKEQNKAYGKAYRESHREQARQYAKEYYQKHKDVHNLKYKKKRGEVTEKWLAENRDRWNAYQREYQKRRRAEGRI